MAFVKKIFICCSKKKIGFQSAAFHMSCIKVELAVAVSNCYIPTCEAILKRYNSFYLAFVNKDISFLAEGFHRIKNWNFHLNRAQQKKMKKKESYLATLVPSDPLIKTGSNFCCFYLKELREGSQLARSLCSQIGMEETGREG